MTLRQRLTLVLGLVLTLAFALVTLAHYRALRQAVEAEVDETLDLRAQALAREIGSFETPPGSYDPEVFFQLVDDQGRVRLASSGLELEPLPAEPVGTTFTSQLRGTPVRMLVRPITVQEGPGLLKVGESLHLAHEGLRRSVTGLLLASLAGLVLALASTWAVLRHGLRPLKRLAQVAREILDTGDFSRRVPESSPQQDAVGSVARLLNRLLARVQGLLESQQRLLADTSHELRNPLTVIRTDIDLLARELPPDVRQEVAEEMAREVERMTRLVEDLLALSWADQKLPMRSEPVRLDVLAQELVERSRRSHPERKLEFHSVDAVCLQGDRERLLQAASNLVENALRYSRGAVRVRVYEKPGWAVLEVEDEGPGIPPEQQEAIFERFVRLDSSRSRSTGGTGLGLPIVKALVEAHGGRVQLHSTPGKGSRFSFRVPLDGVNPAPQTER